MNPEDKSMTKFSINDDEDYHPSKFRQGQKEKQHCDTSLNFAAYISTSSPAVGWLSHFLRL